MTPTMDGRSGDEAPQAHSISGALIERLDLRVLPLEREDDAVIRYHIPHYQDAFCQDRSDRYLFLDRGAALVTEHLRRFCASTGKQCPRKPIAVIVRCDFCGKDYVLPYRLLHTSLGGRIATTVATPHPGIRRRLISIFVVNSRDECELVRLIAYVLEETVLPKPRWRWIVLGEVPVT